jgi:hypothetical protein
MGKLKSRLSEEEGDKIASMYMLLKVLSSKMGIDMRSIESQEFKEEHSSYRTITDSSMKSIVIKKRERKQFNKDLQSL